MAPMQTLILKMHPEDYRRLEAAASLLGYTIEDLAKLNIHNGVSVVLDVRTGLSTAAEHTTVLARRQKAFPLLPAGGHDRHWYRGSALRETHVPCTPE